MRIPVWFSLGALFAGIVTGVFVWNDPPLTEWFPSILSDPMKRLQITGFAVLMVCTILGYTGLWIYCGGDGAASAEGR
jgi:hypothetical protein